MLVSVVFYVWAGGVSAVWVEICGVKDDGGGCETAEPVVGEGRRGLGSLPIRPFFRLLGRDIRTAASGISTFSAGFHDLGRDF